MRPAAWILLGVLATLGCSPRPAAAGPESCAPTTVLPDPAASAWSLEGEYRLRLVATTGPRRDSSADGTLTLVRPGPEVPPARGVVLLGHGELRLEEVGATAADLASEDPARPGVVVLETVPRPGDSASARILLRLGAEANRTDVVRLEGASTVLRVRELGDSTFAGEWTANAPLPVAEGYFCAWRAPAVGE